MKVPGKPRNAMTSYRPISFLIITSQVVVLKADSDIKLSDIIPRH